VCRKRLVELVGTRYSSETGILKLVSDHYPNKQENTLNCMRLLRNLLEEVRGAVIRPRSYAVRG